MAIWHSVSCACADCLDSDAVYTGPFGYITPGSPLFEEEEGK